VLKLKEFYLFVIACGLTFNRRVRWSLFLCDG